MDKPYPITISPQPINTRIIIIWSLRPPKTQNLNSISELDLSQIIPFLLSPNQLFICV